jgi:alpha-ketoglutarate-dependent taurine dioxygenase
MTIRIEKVKELIGGIAHVDKAKLCDDEVVAACREALEERGVLVFPQIFLTDKEQLAFTDKFGERVNFTKTVPGGDKADEADVYKITLDKKANLEPEYVLGTWFWHIDGVTIDQPLPKTTFLSARQLSDKGGQTEFASTFAAYEAPACARCSAT